MFTTFIIVFITTMVIVFIIRVAVKKFSDLQESRSARTRQTTTTTISASRQDTERGTTRVYSIHRRSSLPIMDSQRPPPPPQYDQSILNDFSILNQNERKEIIISDKDLPSYDEVIAQKVRESEQQNTSATAPTMTTTSETITGTGGTDTITTTTVNSHTNNSCNNNDNSNSIRINTTIVTVTPMINTPLYAVPIVTVTPRINTPLYAVPNQQS